ncbi:MAG: calcium-binding protein [Phenylobacterium sp.]|uniref:calcium-binding protein n=1 Tax=Phenylobacterium sp. TaxID=1871053 RepID=UPI002734755E|nr:calcium-binding protein [Phenylobacterium sp.]MDP3749286.1 calcium-binding protein [Phenylobacterium sp.]
MPTLLVIGPYTLAAGATLQFQQQDGLHVEWSADRSAFDVSIGGRIEVTASGPVGTGAGPGYFAAAYIGDWPGSKGQFVIEPTGVLAVTTTGSAWGQGVYNGSWGPDIINRGTIQLTSQGGASAITTYSSDSQFDGPLRVENSGTITVNADQAYGVRIMNQGHFANSGSIALTSRFDTEAVYMFGFGGTFNNSGTIRVSDLDPQRHSAAVMLETGTANDAGVSFSNSGLIEGDYALLVRPMQASPPVEQTPIQAFANSGEMRGMVHLGDSWSSFRNSGLVVGSVNLGRGKDTYDGQGGRVDGVVSGGDGADSMRGGDFADTLRGDGGADTIVAGSGDDQLEGGPQNDVLDGGAGFDTLYLIGYTTADLGAGTTSGYFGDDTITGIERVLGSEAEDTVFGSSGSDTIWGDKGADVVHGRAGDDSLSGGDGDDFMRGEEGSDFLVGGSGFDDMHGNMGRDTLYGGEGPDWVVGGKDEDLLFGDAGIDVVHGNMGADTLLGGADRDVLRGGQDNDTLAGESGDDWLSGDRGDDTIAGGAGADVFHAIAEAGVDRIVDFSSAEGDRVLFEAPGQTYVLTFQAGDAIVDLGGGHRMILVGVNQATLGDWLAT